MMKELLDVRGMQVVFHTREGMARAVRDASFTVRPGEVMAIVGESGSGKSVLTQACLRLIPSPPGKIEQGEALFDGRDFLKATDRELLRIRGRDISIIFQDAMTALNPTMRIGQQITEMILEHAGFTPAEAQAHTAAILAAKGDPAALSHALVAALRPTPAALVSDLAALQKQLAADASEQGVRAWLTKRGHVTRKQAAARAVELLRMVKIPEPEKRMRQYIFQCSGGMRQRAMIAMALSCRPRLLIADEPTTALDVTIKTEILDLLVSLTHELDASIILITHDLGMVASYADRIGVMYGGQFVETGTSEQIFYQATHPYTRGLLKAVPRLDLPQDQTLATIPGAPPNLLSMPAGCAFGPRCEHCMQICKTQMPPLTELAPGHTLRCWLRDPRAAAQRTAFEEGGAALG